MAKLVKSVVYALTVEALAKIKGPVNDKYFLHFSFYDSRTQLYKGEFTTTDQHQQHFLPGKKAFFFVCEVQQYGEMICPMPEGYTQNEDMRDMTDSEKAKFYSTPAPSPVSQEQQLPKQNTGRVVAGTIYSVAMTHAVNLYGSLAGCVGIEAYSKEKLFGMAQDIESYLLERQKTLEG